MNHEYQCLPEVKYYKFNFSFFFVTTLIISLPLIALSFSKGVEGDAYRVMLFIYLLMLLPFIIYYYYQWNYFKNLSPNHIQIVTLDQVESSWIRTMAFVIEMEINGHKKRISTQAVFRTGLFGPNDISEYSMKKARVGYDPNRGIAVILELL
ncbi:MAG TPA: hypothetical protein PLR26_04775 [Bacilli bacterium]|nr:hypothetical protein [Bacilli bacterium]